MRYIPDRDPKLAHRIFKELQSMNISLRVMSEKLDIPRPRLKKQADNTYFCLSQSEWERLIIFSEDECKIDVLPRV
jgi:hypothetical protein